MSRPPSLLLFVALVLVAGCESSPPSLPSSTSEVGSTTAASDTVSQPTTTVTVPRIVVRVVDDGGLPIEGAAVGGSITGPDGSALFDRTFSPIAISAPGFEPRFVHEPEGDELLVELRHVVIDGVVESEGGDPFTGVRVTLGDVEAVTDMTGRFTFRGQPAGVIRVDVPARHAVEYEWGGRESWVRLVIEPIQVRALHVTGWAVADPEHWRHLLDLAATTEINALVVDLKDESGRVFYPSAVTLAAQAGAVGTEYRLEDIVDTARDLDLYLIGRLVTFQDPIAARNVPALAARNGATGEPLQLNGQYYLDPTDPVARRYALDLAVEACAAGFDEIQFDYVRYPAGGNGVFDGGSGDADRPVVIRDFLAEASDLLHPAGCAVAADIFGFITSTFGDGGIGQQLEELAPVVDVLSPMLYPSHYSEGWFGFTVPNDHPGAVVANALDNGLDRLGSTVVLRPWIQDFYYTGEQVRAEIDAAEDRGLGWMLWNALSRFSEGALGSSEE